MKPQPTDLHHASRRQILQGGGVLALGVLAPGRADPATPTSQAVPSKSSIYTPLGVRPLINARGTVTIVGATRTLPEVKRAMEAAAREYVQIDELMEGVARRLAELTGAEWGLVTSGASAALTAATAASIAGGDPDKMAQLPDLRGLKDEVIAPRYSRTAYDHAIKSVGAHIVEVETRDQLMDAFGPRTAMVMVLAGRGSEEGPLSLREIAALAKPRGIPILVDAAADALVVPNPYLGQGADLVAYSGGKCLRGPQCAGLLLGRKSLVEAARVNTAPHHGLGRGLKVGREEVMGMLAAVEAWTTRDHEAEMRTWRSWLETIASRVGAIAGVTTEIREPRGLSNRTPSLLVRWDVARIPLTGEAVEQLLWDGEPRIAVSGAGSFLPFPPNPEPTITVVPYQLEAGEERIIADRVHAVLSKPPAPPPAPEAPAFDLSGRWNVDVTFSASTTRQSFALEQQGRNVRGTHHASFAARDINGTLHGRTIVLRSSYTQQGVRLNFTFTGTAEADAMEGDVSLGEYGTATWKAART
jgi:uncharacterized pyridoxal phosphate-dependent enzyme